jgi:hypothetical protein
LVDTGLRSAVRVPAACTVVAYAADAGGHVGPYGGRWQAAGEVGRRRG